MTPTQIPFAVTPRPDTGFSNAQLGLGLFIAADVMLFAGLFSSYVLLRVNASIWPPDGHHPAMIFGAAKTVLALLSSAALLLSRSKLGPAPSIAGLSIAAAATSLFLALTGVEYAVAINRGMLPAVNTYIGMFYALTGVHALHLFGGFLTTLFVAFTGAPLGKTDPQRLLCRSQLTGLYSHFMTVVWFAIFAVLYLA